MAGPDGASSAARRAGIVGLCAVVAVLAIGNGLDRASVNQPWLGRLVPSPFAASSLIGSSSEAFRSHRYRQAERLARAAIEAAPVEPESAGLLGGALFGQGNVAGAERAFMVAGQFGWRIPLTQYYWMQQALAVGDYRVAALRLDAMLRQDPELITNRALMSPLESSEAGRKALADRLAQKPGWLTKYASQVSDIPPEVATVRADVLDILARQGKPLGCSAIGPLTTALANAGDTMRAYAIWRAHCPQRATGLVSDADFAALQVHQPDSPFDWVVIGDGDVSLSVDPLAQGRGHRLVIASSASFPRKVLTQLSPIPPGNYRLEWSARTESGAADQRIKATVSCQPDSREWLPARLDPASRKFVADVVVDNACAARWIGFSILPGQDALSFGEVALRPVR